MKRYKRYVKRVFSMIFAFIMLSTATPMLDVVSFAADVISTNYLEGWRVDVAWSTMSRDFEWNAERDEDKQAKLFITYRVDNAERDYAPGDLTFTVQGIDSALRGGMLKAQSNAADEDDSQWSYTHEESTGIYTFTNKFSLAKGKSMNGGFEFMWDMSARDNRNDTTISASPTFTISGETNDSINLPTVSYYFSSVRDRYRLDMTYRKFNSNEWGIVDRLHTWYDVSNDLDMDVLARGLYRSSYYVWFDIPESEDPDKQLTIDDFEFLNSDGTITPQKVDGYDNRYGFYLYENRDGDAASTSFQFGVDREKSEGVELEFHGHLSRLYNDETEWVEDSIGDHDYVDNSVKMTIESYSFVYQGNAYEIDKVGDSYPSSPYMSRFNSKGLYNDTLVQFQIKAQSHKTYGEAAAASEASIIANEDGNENIPVYADEADTEVIQATDGPTFDEVRANENEIMPVAWMSGNVVHDEGDLFDMVLGDDKLAIETNKGEIRDFKDDEYDISYVTLTTSTEHIYELYAADTQDEEPGKYRLVSQGTIPGKSIRIQLDPGCKAVYAVIHDMSTDQSYATMDVGVTLHFNWDEQLTLDADDKINSEGRFVNFGYIRSLYGPDGSKDDDVLGVPAYDGVYGEKMAERDERMFGKILFRDYHNIFLRSSATEISTSVSMDNYEWDGIQRYNSHIKARASVKADESGVLNKFSLYVTIPDGVMIDYDELMQVTGTGLFAGSDLSADLANYVTISEDTVDGERVVVFDFDMTSAPLEISNNTNIEAVIPVYLPMQNFKEYGNKYKAESYFMVLDNGIEKFTGNGLARDDFDLDRDGSVSDYLVRSSTTKTVYDVVSEWNESIMKYVKSAYTSGYQHDAVVKAYKDGVDKETEQLSRYSYRLDYELGSNAAANIVFYDSIEQGAFIQVEGDGADETEFRPSEWQGQFDGVDVSDIELQGGKVEFYWSEDPHMMEKSAITESGKKPEGLATEGWNRVPDDDWNNVDKIKVKSIAVKMDTSELEGGVLKAPSTVSLYINMLAPSDSMLAGKKAVNQFTVGYSGYNLDGYDGERYVLPSNETTVELMDNVAMLTIQKVDPENILRYDENGEPVYARLTGGSFNIYNSEKELLDGSPFSLNSMGQIVLSNIEYGIYYWEEVEAPQGYIKQEGLHEIICDKPDNLIEIENERKVATVVLFKYDKQYIESGNPRTIGPAYFNLYKANGEKVYYIKSGANEYTDNPSEPGASDEFIATGCSISKLPWGSYYWKEIQAPPGYVLDDEPIYFTVGAADDANISDDEFSGLSVPPISQSQSTSFVKFIKTFNEEKRGSIRLIKKDQQTGKTLEGAVFNLYRSPNGSYDGGMPILVKSNVRTNSVGEIEFNDLQYGYYNFEEVRAPQGYVLPASSSQYNFVGRAYIDATNYDKNIEYTIENSRINGRVQLVKKDNLGQYVAGAEYELWYRSDMVPESTPYSMLGRKTTDDDGVITFENLQWGEYYFKETKAPEGYAVSDEEIRFSINAQNAASEVFLEVTDERAKGKVQVVKVDGEDNTRKLQGAEFELYDLNGALMKAGEDYRTDAIDNRILTDAEGQVTISGLNQGSYYLQETKAPSGYSKRADPVRFSVTLKSSQTLQVLEVENVRDRATITINKKINEVFDEFGNPTFVFRLKGKTTGRVYTKSVTLSQAQLQGSITFDVDAGEEYEIYEYESSRYGLKNIESVENIKDINVSENTCTADLTSAMSAEVTYTNEMTQYEKNSDTSNRVNIAAVHAKLLSLYLSYTGPKTIDDTTMKDGSGYVQGYDPIKDEYTFQDSDAVLMAVYDDGTEVPVKLSECVLDPLTVSGLSNDTSVTVNVTYTDKWGMSASNSFYVTNNLQVSQRYKIHIDLDGGSVIEGGLGAIDYNNLKMGVSITLPTADEIVKDGYELTGFDLLDKLGGTHVYKSCKPGDMFTVLNMYYGSNRTFQFKAKWTKIYNLKMAVQIYGINQDKWADVDMSVEPDSVPESEYKQVGLTFGAAVGDHRYTGVSHAAADVDRVGIDPDSVTDLCLHNMSWDRIVYWSKTKPQVFQRCLETGCTHSVEMTLYEEMVNGEGTVYPDNAPVNAKQPIWPDIAEWTGDGAAGLRTVIANDYMLYTRRSSDGGWGESGLRSHLNGIRTNGTVISDLTDLNRLSILHALPDVLENEIVPKVVKYDSDKADFKNSTKTTYDKLWIPSMREIYSDTPEDWEGVEGNANKYKIYMRENEGETYQFFKIAGLKISNHSSRDFVVYADNGMKPNVWLRSLTTEVNQYALTADAATGCDYNVTPTPLPLSWTASLALYFCLPGPETSASALSVVDTEINDVDDAIIALNADNNNDAILETDYPTAPEISASKSEMLYDVTSEKIKSNFSVDGLNNGISTWRQMVHNSG